MVSPMNTKHKRDSGVWEILIVTFVILMVMAIGAPILIQRSRTQHSDIATYNNKINNQEKTINSYKAFWSYYKTIMKERADTDGNNDISLNEIKTFQDQFFGNLELTVDPVTKVITKKDGTLANQASLICHLKSFYVDKEFIRPVCPAL